MNKEKNLASFRPWMVWFLSATFGSYQFLLQGSPSVMISGLMEAFSIDIVQVGFLTSTFFYTYLVMQIPTGMLIDRFGPKRILIIGIIMCSLGCIFFGLSQTLLQAQLGRLIMGLMSAPGILTTLCLASRWFPPHRFVLLVGLTETLALFGGGIGQITLAHTVGWWGWRETIYICATFGLVLSTLVFLVVKDWPPGTPDESKRMHFSMSFRQSIQNFVHILRIPQIWINGLFSGLVFSIVPAFAALWCIPFLMQRYSIVLNTAANTTALLFIGACIGAPLIGYYSEYLKRRRKLMLIGNIITIIFMCLVIYIHTPLWLMALLLFILGFSTGVYALPFAIVSEILPKKVKGMAMGITNLLSISIGAPILQPLIGWLLKIFGTEYVSGKMHSFSDRDYIIALTAFPVCLILSLCIGFLVRETYCKVHNMSRISE